MNRRMSRKLGPPPCKLDELWLRLAFPGESALVIENQRETTAAPGTVQQAATCWRTGVSANSCSIYSTCFNYVPLHGKQTSKQ